MTEPKPYFTPTERKYQAAFLQAMDRYNNCSDSWYTEELNWINSQLPEELRLHPDDLKRKAVNMRKAGKLKRNDSITRD